MRTTRNLVVILCLAVMISACQTTATQRGAGGGALMGGVLGQMIGGNTKSTLLGAGAGMLAGALANDYMSQQKTNSYNQGVNRGYTSRPPSVYTPPIQYNQPTQQNSYGQVRQAPKVPIQVQRGQPYNTEPRSTQPKTMIYNNTVYELDESVGMYFPKQ